MWSLLASLPTEAPQAVGLPDELPYGLLIGLLGAGLQLLAGEIWRLVASEGTLRIDARLDHPGGADSGPWRA